MPRDKVNVSSEQISGTLYQTQCTVCRWRAYYQDPNLFRCEQCKRVNMAGMEYLYTVQHHDFFEIEQSGGNRAYVEERAEYYAMEDWWRQVREQKLIVLIPPEVSKGRTWMRVEGMVVRDQ